MADMQQLARILWRHLGILVVVALLAGGAAWMFTAHATPTYTATTTLFIAQSVGTDAQPSYDSVLVSQYLAKTYTELMVSQPVLDTVITQNHLAIDVATLAKQVTVDTVRDTRLLQLTVKASDGQQAAIVANQIVQVFNAQQRLQRTQQADAVEQKLRQELAPLQSTIDQLQTQIDALSGDASNTNRAQLDAQLQAQRALAAPLIDRIGQLHQTTITMLDPLTVITAAQPPESPTHTNRIIIVGLAAALGVLLASGVVMLMAQFDQTLRTLSQAEEAAQRPVLGTLPLLSHLPAQDQLVVTTHPATPGADAFRTAWIASEVAAEKPLRTVLITAVDSRVDITPYVLNLALAVAQTAKKVVLVDADSRASHGATLRQRVQNVSAQALLEQWLTLTSLSAVMTTISGTETPTTGIVSHSTHLAEVLQHLHANADLVLVYAPPLDTTSDALLLGRDCDAALLMVSLAATQASALTHAQNALQRSGASLIGMLLIDPTFAAGFVSQQMGRRIGAWLRPHRSETAYASTASFHDQPASDV